MTKKIDNLIDKIVVNYGDLLPESVDSTASTTTSFHLYTARFPRSPSSVIVTVCHGYLLPNLILD